MDTYAALLNAFEKGVSKYPELPAGKTKELLERGLKRKKFDAQDEAIIEAILKDSNNPLEEFFAQGLNAYIGRMEQETNLKEILKSEAGQSEVVEVFLCVLENLINYFYNTLIAKHLAGS